MTIGERIREARKAKGISQLCLAMRCDMCYQSRISVLERGIKIPTLRTLGILARELGVTVDWLINGESEA